MNPSRGRELVYWLGDAKHVWISAGTTVFALIVALRPGTREPCIRYTGLALQLMGIGTVIWGIRETRALFGYPSIRTKIAAWFQRFPLWGHNSTVGATGMAVGLSGGKVQSRSKHGPIGPNPTLGARVAALEKNIDAIHDRIDATQKEFDSALTVVGNDIKAETQIRQDDGGEMRKALETMGTGGIHISVVGASWLLVGVVLTTAAPELADFLK